MSEPAAIAKVRGNKNLHATVKGPDGKLHNLGRVDRKYWAPRAWWYRFITFPLLAKKYGKGL